MWFFPGQTSETISVPTMNDYSGDSENFQVDLSKFVGAVGSDQASDSGSGSTLCYCIDTTASATGYIDQPSLALARTAYRTGGNLRRGRLRGRPGLGRSVELRDPGQRRLHADPPGPWTT